MLTSPLADDGAAAAPGLSDTVFSTIDFTNGALVAISGGGDSTALLLLLKNYLDRHAPRAPLLAVTVDHGLRADSAAEARAVSRLCAEKGIDHKTMLWEGDKPSTGLPAAAREARYRLLAQAAGEAGVRLILTGHTADDQAETVLMRQERADTASPHGRGLAGMAAATLYDWDIWIVRPLLGAKRQALREFLRREKMGWIDDPTNQDETFERPRIRAALKDRGRSFVEATALAMQEAEIRRNASRRAAAIVRAFASRPAPGLIRLDPAFAAGDRSAAIAALRVLLATIGGTAFPPGDARTAALFDKMAAAAPFRATLSRTVIDKRRAAIFLHRELRDLPTAASAVDGMVWDGRRRIDVGDEANGLLVEPPALRAAAADMDYAGNAPASLLRAASAAEPCFRRDLECSAAANDRRPGVRISPVIAPYARYLPLFDFELAGAVAELIGAPPLPSPPFRGFDASRSLAKA
ncbi:MAG TPA: tRNA lysidine(34) synthetase TilS [Mesorhizobium sp.]